MNEIFNFSAGPGMLPPEVLNQIEEELRNWHDLKISVMEISHRSDEFYEMVHNSENDLRELLNISNSYKVLFCHGGARTQFSSIPMNLLRSFDDKCIADYIDSGYWSRSAAAEGKKYCKLNIVDVNILDRYNMRAVKKMKYWELSNNSVYLHYCPNETVDGIAIYETPKFDDIIVVGDFSSTLLSRPINVNSYSIIYAAAQKNIGLPGLTIIIIHKDLLNRSCNNQIPSTLKYSLLSDHQSMFNTPPTFSWYVAGLIFKWIKKNGGLSAMNSRNKEKANLLYKTIDSSDCYYNNITTMNRSYMNVPFYLHNEELNNLFLKESSNIGLYALKGHISVGGMRASLYNAMPLKGVQILVEFMEWFARKYG